jgi:hypothetical protein
VESSHVPAAPTSRDPAIDLAAASAGECSPSGCADDLHPAAPDQRSE